MKNIYRHILRTVLIAGLIFSSRTGAFATSTYYAKVTGSSNPTGKGTVYVSATQGTYSSDNATTSTTTSGGNVTLYLKAENTDAGYHFSNWTGSGSFESSTSAETNVTVAAATTADETNEYTVTANFIQNIYYAKVTATAGTGGTASVTGDSQKSSTTASDPLTFNVTATANTGYHFTGWTASPSGSFGSTTSAGTTFTGNASSTYDEENAVNYTVTAGFGANYYTRVNTAVSGSGTAYVAYGSSFSGSSTSATDGNGQGWGGYVETYSLKATPAAGYHFVKWTVPNAKTITNSTSASTTITVETSSSYQGSSNPRTFTATATFEQDQYNAQLNTAVSTALSGTSAGTAQVQANDSSWGASATKTSSSGNTNVAFSIKATAVKGYQFKGWSEANGSTTYVSTTASTTYNVKSSSTLGGTNSKNLYAVFDKGTYTVRFLGDSKPAHVVTGSMADQTFTSGVAQNLTANGYVCNFVVTYDAQGGVAKNSGGTVITSETQDRFTRWQEWVGGDSKASYNDKEAITRTEDHGTIVNLTATWADKRSFVLPSATRTEYGVNYTFLGWYDAATGGNRIGDAGAKVNISESKTLYAHWDEPCITINANSSSYTSGDKAVFNVTRSGTPATHYRVVVPIGGSLVLSNVPIGEYTVAPDNWSWNYTASPASSTQNVTTSVPFNFTITSKGSEKKHSESTKTNVFGND